MVDFADLELSRRTKYSTMNHLTAKPPLSGIRTRRYRLLMQSVSLQFLLVHLWSSLWFLSCSGGMR